MEIIRQIWVVVIAIAAVVVIIVVATAVGAGGGGCRRHRRGHHGVCFWCLLPSAVGHHCHLFVLFVLAGR